MKIQPIIHPLLLLIMLLAISGFFLWKTYFNQAERSQKLFMYGKMALISLLIFAINLRPMRPSYTTEVLLKNIDVLFVVDNTISMYAEEGVFTTRMNQVADDMKEMMKELDGSNFALIRFDNQSQILSPFTQDTRNIEDILDIITYPDTYYARGSNLNVPYVDMEALLTSSAKKDNRTTILFFFSDGEITDDSTLSSYAPLAALVDGGAVLGYGSEEGSKMYVDKYSSSPLYDPTTGEDALSKLDEKTLLAIADDLQIDYVKMPNATARNNIIKKIVNMSSSIIGDSNAVSYEDMYYYFAIPLVLLLLWEGVVFIRKGRF